jgi:D-sedoheptulose 7-phosphate isomerase
MAPIAAISLASEPATLSAIGNDVGFELIFLRQIIARCHPSDVAFAFSTSGGSKNIVAALGEARKRGMLTVALLGYDGGEIAREGLADHAIVVDCDYIPRLQETQAAIYHVLRETLGQGDA